MLDNICMTADEKALAQAYLPVSDEGGMRFPRREFFPFLSLMQLYVNYKAFEKHGNQLFRVRVHIVCVCMCSPHARHMRDFRQMLL